MILSHESESKENQFDENQGGGGGSQRSQISLQSRPEYKKRRKKDWFPALIDFKMPKTLFLYFKVLNKIYSRDIF
jgi:hypothetical protein